jgi:hypothetical protein
MKNKYGEYTEKQIADFKKRIRKKIYFLLLAVDKDTADQFPHLNKRKAFKSLLYELGGASSVFFEPDEIVEAVNLLEEARNELFSEEFSFLKYRKLLLDAGGCIERIKEVS